MSTADFVKLYVQCYPGVRNEMAMRANADSINGRFIVDDQVMDGYMYAIAWLVFTKETLILSIPESYGRLVSVRVYDVWDTLVSTFTKVGVYELNIPDMAAGFAIAKVACNDPSNEQEYNMAYDVMTNILVEDVGLGVNDYEDVQTLVPAAYDLTRKEPKDLSGKEFFAIANAVYKFNPFTSPSNAWILLQKTMSKTAMELDGIKKKGLHQIA